jgi:solute carrier family 25 (mitochondrial folate transporter), member 32
MNQESGSHLIAGAISGAVATGFTAPLELIKTVLQTGVAQNKGSITLLKEYAQMGGLKACFRGLAPTLAGIVPHNGIYFALYGPFKRQVQELILIEQECLASGSAAIIAGSAANIVTNPIWVVKTKMSALPNRYPTIYNSFQRIYKEEGMRGYFKGLGSSLLGVSHVLIQFPAYEFIKDRLSDDPNSKSLISIGVASMASKFLATLFTYPIEVFRVRCQMHIRSKQEPLQFFKLLKNHGIRSFYSGFLINMLRTIPATIVSLSLYESILDKISRS